MKNVEKHLLSLLTDQRALTILKLDDGWMITFANLVQEGEDIYFVPTKVLLTEESFDEALSLFHKEQLMDNVSGYQA